MKQRKESLKSINIEDLERCTPEEQISILKKALRVEELRADAFDELINVAESKFNISIRKKAGAKQ